MKDYPSRRILTVFLASPGDVGEERRAAREISDKVNRQLAHRLGWHVDLRGWEDQTPGFGRPQSLINRESVESCDLFIGLLWKRWGQPTGEFSSGFEEEYAIARQRRLATGFPEIALFFKAVDEAAQSDPGPQLARVLAFKEHLINSKELLFVTVNTVDEWCIQVEAVLTKAVLDVSQVPKAENEARTVPRTEGRPHQALPSTARDSSALRQIEEVRGYISDFVGNNGARVITEHSSFEELRTFLLASSWMALHTNEVLSTHQGNRLYVHRALVQLLPDERRLLIRSLVADKSGVVPGWYWLSEWNESVTRATLFLFASDAEPNEVVRAGAIRLLAQGRYTPDPGWMRAAVSYAAREPSSLVRLAWTGYLTVAGELDDTSILDALAGDKDQAVRAAAIRAKLLTLCRLDPNEALRRLCLAPPADEVETFLSQLQLNIGSVNTDTLRHSSECSDMLVRAFSIRELVCRGELTVEQIHAFLRDESDLIKEIAAAWLRDHKVAVEPELIEEHLGHTRTRIASELLTHVSVRELEEKADFFTLIGPAAYSVLARDHYSVLSMRIRHDLMDQFETLREESLVRLRRTTLDYAQTVIDAFNKIDRAVRDKFTAGALIGLVVNGVPSDVEFARNLLSSSDPGVQRAAIDLIERFGDGSDVERLLLVISSAHGDTQRKAAATALKLADRKINVVHRLLHTEEAELVGMALEFLVKSNPDKAREVLQAYLNNDSATVRYGAMARLIKDCSEQDVEVALAEYLRNDTYYYDVVSWLDRILYAPSSLREHAQNYVKAVSAGRPRGRLLLETILGLAGYVLQISRD